jgi:hypothetical protein
MQRIGVTRRASDRACDAAYSAQREFQDKLLAAGRRALDTLDGPANPGLVLAGRGYNIYDRGVNCDIPRKLRQRYGANVIPLDFLVTGRESLDPGQYVLGLRPQDSGSRADCRQPPQPAPGVHHQLQVRARFLHQTLRPRGRRRAAADSAIRRARQRRRAI